MKSQLSTSGVAMVQRRRALLPIIVALYLSNLLCTLGKLECEELPAEDCAFSVSSSGSRCVLEKYRGKDDTTHIECQSSMIMAGKQEEWIESDDCIKSCGLERMSFGLSTDLLLDMHFTEMLCSLECLNDCPNIIDLYISLAAGEGMYLPQLCEAHRMSSRRLIADPVKKARDAEHQRSLLLPQQLTAGGPFGPSGMEPTPTPPGAPELQKGSEAHDGPPSRPSGHVPYESHNDRRGSFPSSTATPFVESRFSFPSSPHSNQGAGGYGSSLAAPSPLGAFQTAEAGTDIDDIVQKQLVTLEQGLVDDEELLYQIYFN